jgi:single-strand DNA-binding protein
MFFDYKRDIDMNQITIAGHLGADPEVRFTSSNQKVTTLRVASRVRKDETIWWKVTVWGEQFDKMIAYLKKGSPVIIVGELNKPEIFTDRDGKPQVSMSMTASNIQFSPFGKPEGQSRGGADANSHDEAQEPSYAAAGEQIAYGQGKGNVPFTDDDVPF